MDSKPNPQLLVYAMGAALIMSSGSADFINPENDERRFWPIDTPKTLRPPMSKNAQARKKAAQKDRSKKKTSKKARKVNRHG